MVSGVFVAGVLFGVVTGYCLALKTMRSFFKHFLEDGEKLDHVIRGAIKEVERINVCLDRIRCLLENVTEFAAECEEDFKIRVSELLKERIENVEREINMLVEKIRNLRYNLSASVDEFDVVVKRYLDARFTRFENSVNNKLGDMKSALMYVDKHVSDLEREILRLRDELKRLKTGGV